MITVALAKGALLKDSVASFAKAGLDFQEVLDSSNRLLMVPSACGRAKAILVRNGDVPVYVAYGQAQLGIVGFDVLQEKQLPVANLVDLGFGECRMSVAVKSNTGYKSAVDLPPHCRVASKFTGCAGRFFEELDIPIELVHLTGSVELGPLTGIAEAIVDLVATGRTLRDNGLVDGEWWDESTSEPQLSLEWEELEDMGLLLGDRLTFSVAGESVTARITSTRRINWDSFSPNFFMVVNPGLMERFAHTYITSFYLESEKRATALSLASAMPGVSVIDIDAVLDQVKRAMGSAALAVQYVFLFTLAAGVMVLLAAIQSTRDERMYESAVLRTLGAGRKVILQGVAAEFIALGVIAGILAATSAGALGIFLSREFFDLVYLPGPLLGLYGLLIGAVVVGVSGTLATRSVVSEPPVSTLRSI